MKALGKTGALAGALIGFFDTLAVLGWSVEGLGVRRVVALLALEMGLLGLAGAALGALCGAVGVCAARAAHRFWGKRAWWRAGLAAVATVPWAAWVSTAAFRGHWAASLPGHRLLAVGLFLVCVASVAAGTELTLKMLAASRLTRTATRKALGVSWVLLAVGLGAASRFILPRLYGWFHASLALAAFFAMLVAVATWPSRQGSELDEASHRHRTRKRFAGGLAALLVLAALGIVEARRSQMLRFALHEKTVVGRELAARLPLPLQPRPLAAVERQQAEDHLPPLPEGPRRPEADVLLITVDALRADHVGAYGYPRNTTPHIDALAQRATRFEVAYAQAPHTSFSVASMLTGKYFPTLARLAPAEVHDPLPAILRGYGWRTAAFYPPAVFFVDAKKLKAYQDSNFSFEYVKCEYLDAQKRVDQIQRYFEEVKPARAFVWVHFFEPHEPYDARPGFDFGTGDRDRYDSEIAYTDAAIGRLLEYVAAQRPHTIVMLAADHGEEFDEHGGRYHGSTLYEEQIRVPFLVAVPGMNGQRVAGPVELLDITPTVLNLLDIPVPARVRGTDLGPWLAESPADPARLPPAFAEVEDKRMIVLGREKVICDLNWGFCAYYDLVRDPGEHHNLAEEQPERLAALRARLDDWLDGHVRLEPTLGKGMANPDGGPVPRAIERGRLGDLSVAPELAQLMVSNAEVSVRQEAAQLLTGLPPRPALAALVEQALSSDDPLVADWAAVAGTRLGLETALPRARAIAQNAATPSLLRVRASLALANRADATGVPALAGALDDHDDVLLNRLIILALGKLGDPRAVPALLEHVQEVQNRREMVDALGDIADVRATSTLSEHLNSDAYVPVRAQAAKALANVAAHGGDRPQIRGALEQAFRDEKESSVREAIRGALSDLEAGRKGRGVREHAARTGSATAPLRKESGLGEAQ